MDLVWVLTIYCSKREVELYVHASQTGAEDTLYRYVQEQWGKTSRLAMPSDRGATIRYYFKRPGAADRYTIHEAEVGD